MNTTPTSEARIWAVLAHLSALAFGMGILLPVVGWSEQRRKSNYASFQCLQALGYQSVGYTIWALFSAVAAIFFVVAMLPTLNAATGTNEVEILVSKFVIFIFGLSGIYVLLPIIAAISCALGKNFHYPIMGRRLVRYLTHESTEKSEGQKGWNENRELQWVAAMGHFSILVILWGMLAPATAWILYGKRSTFLKFQSIQTLLYQVSVTILYLGSVFLFLLAITIIASFALMGWAGDLGVDSSMGLVGIIFFGGSLLVLFVVVLLVPLLHILGQWAGYRVLKGENYHYPLLGRRVEKWMANQNPLSTESDLSLKGTS